MSYLCFVYVRAESVPEFRVLDCEDDLDAMRSAAAVLREWPSAHRVEVMDDSRLVLTASAKALEGFRTG